MRKIRKKPAKMRCYKNHLGITHPELAMVLHPTKNSHYRIENLTQGSERIVWWLCPVCKTDWPYSIFKRVRGKGKCPTCYPTQVPLHKSLGYNQPNLIKEWHPIKNKPLTPFNISTGSGKRVWWKCSTCSHEWETVAASRGSGQTGCPICAHKKQNEYLKSLQRIERDNNLLVTHPYLKNCWDTEKNYPLTLKHVTENSNRKTWWKCPCCHHSSLVITASFVKAKTSNVCKKCRGILYEIPS